MTVAVIVNRDESFEVVELKNDMRKVISDPFAFLDMPPIGRAMMPAAWSNGIQPIPCMVIT
jgi:hypothetical protein